MGPFASPSKCEVCDLEPFKGRFTDTHGEVRCDRCGAAYYTRRDDGGPYCTMHDDWIPVARRYWEETRQKLPCGNYLVNVPGDLAEQSEKFFAWVDENNLRSEEKDGQG